MPGVRFAGEVLTTLDDARALARHWCLEDYGLRRHSRTQRRPLEHFQAEEQPLVMPAPTTPYDIPLWTELKVARDQLVVVDKARYSIPHPYVGQRRVYALLGLVRRYGAARVTEVCAVALDADMLDVKRLQRMLEQAITRAPATPPTARVIPLARYLRPATQYALPLRPPTPASEGEDA